MKNAIFQLATVLLLALSLDCHEVFAQGMGGSAASFADYENPYDPTSLKGRSVSLDAANDEGSAVGNSTSLTYGHSTPLPGANPANDNASGMTYQVQGNGYYYPVFLRRVPVCHKPVKKS